MTKAEQAVNMIWNRTTGAMNALGLSTKLERDYIGLLLLSVYQDGRSDEKIASLESSLGLASQPEPRGPEKQQAESQPVGIVPDGIQWLDKDAFDRKINAANQAVRQQRGGF